MISSSLGRVLLIVACALGFLQGLMILIGGLIAVHDQNDKLNIDTDGFIASSNIDQEYGCGSILARVLPGNLNNKDQDCDSDYQEMDRGWFYRVHDLCDYEGTGYSLNSMCDLRGYRYVYAYAITFGVGWILCAIVAIVAVIISNKIVAFIAGGLFAAFYIVFIVIFSLVWHSVRKVNKKCLNELCKDIKKRGKKSSIEFLIYSIFAFVLIFISIACCFIGALGLESEPETGGASSAKLASSERGADGRVGVDNQESPGEDNRGQEGVSGGGDEGKVTGKKNDKPEPKKPTGVSLAGKEYINKFKQLNKYIADKNKMQRYANKKFDQTDKDKSGTLELKEFKNFVTDIMTKKQLPPPSDRKVQALMKKYDTDKSGTLEKTEFQQMLFEIFLESREILILKYAEKKAASWKPAKSSKKKDTSQLKNLDQLLNESDKFYEELSGIAKKADKNENAMLDIDEVTEMVKMFCDKYKVPALDRDEITEVMFDMERDIREYDVYDLRMVAFAVLAISRNLVK